MGGISQQKVLNIDFSFLYFFPFLLQSELWSMGRNSYQNIIKNILQPFQLYKGYVRSQFFYFHLFWGETLATTANYF